MRTKSKIVTTEAVLWEWLNALADATTRATAAEGYRRVHADSRTEVVPMDRELNAAAVELNLVKSSYRGPANGPRFTDSISYGQHRLKWRRFSPAITGLAPSPGLTSVCY